MSADLTPLTRSTAGVIDSGLDQELKGGQTDGSQTVWSLTKGMVVNADKSIDVYFGPKAPAGKENNWVQTMPGKGWSVILRFYSPLKPWCNKTWRPSEIELVK